MYVFLKIFFIAFCVFLPERERHYFSRPCDSSIGNDCGYTDSDYPRTVVFGHWQNIFFTL